MPIPSDAERFERSQRALAWLNTHWTKSRDCPICGSNTWQIQSPTQWPEFTGESLIFEAGSSLTPVFTVMCQVCGYTFAMNALISGVVERPPDSLPGIEGPGV